MAANDGVRLNVRVQPKASRNALTVEPDGRIRVALTAPPVEGEANKALVAFLAERFGVPKRDIALIRGSASREKVVEIKGVTIGEVEALLRSAPAHGIRS
ncbi:MAG: DUF167 domain-containing protein [Candidatus Hydrogenedentes bacterium]|nr:DUF167 domain-containing protein [Candidatus Hydrogenedentota bacterium]